MYNKKSGGSSPTPSDEASAGTPAGAFCVCPRNGFQYYVQKKIFERVNKFMRYESYTALLDEIQGGADNLS